MLVNLGKIDTAKLHHAYAIEGGEGEALEMLVLLGKELGFTVQGNPDFWHGRFETFGIDEGRALKEMQMNMPASEQRNGLPSRKIFFIQTSFFTREAQNSLLKIFEEPTEHTHFFIFTPTAEILLPTLRSRLVVVRRDPHAEKAAKPDHAEAERFAKASKAERLEQLQTIIEEKDKMGGINFLNQLELYARDRIEPAKMSSELAAFFKELFRMKGYLADRSSSVKMILEHIALTMPAC